ncbi:hypothetical protein DICVIV_01997 [Dictyocaulus viviparus]|uniref:Uncharacterized protein n=1 Tax=Dictyocaulus viviparus TaxID=29172 RepID=A0A0D8YB78_DICVI|nr:hypothetical protein DICVIV_01997 [Dictyocaulus viviparus]
MTQSVKQTKEKEVLHPRSQAIAIIGDSDRTLTNQLIDAVGNGSTAATIHLDTKYYQAFVGVLQFRTGIELLKMTKEKPDVLFGAMILRLDSRNDLEVMANIVQQVNCDSHILVADNCSPDNMNFAQSWAHSYNFELIILNPNKCQIDEAMSLREKCGVARLVEVIENIPWQIKRDYFKKMTGKEELDRLLAIIEAMSDSTEESDIEPDNEDKEAIWQAFNSCGLSPSKLTTLQSAPEECVEEASISVDVTIAKNGRETDQWFSRLPENKVKNHHGAHCSDTPDVTDFNIFQAVKDTRAANLKSNDSAQRVDSATAILSKIVDLKIMDDKNFRHQKTE